MIYSHGSTQLEFSPPDTAKLQEAHELLDNVLQLERETHLTVRYGVDNFCPKKMKEILRKYEPITCVVTGIGCFPETKDGACIHFEVEPSEALLRLRKEVEDNCECIEPTFPEYKPHITIGFVNPAGYRSDVEKVKAHYQFPFEIIADNFTISAKEGKQTVYPLYRNHAAHKIAHLIKTHLSGN